MDDDRKVVPGYRWIIIDPELLGGQPAICGTRLSVSHILACLAEGILPVQLRLTLPTWGCRARQLSLEVGRSFGTES